MKKLVQKRNSVQYDRKIEDILRDYLQWLQKKGVDVEVESILKDEVSSGAYLEDLLRKCYDQEAGLWYFVTFVVGPEPRTRQHIWNKFVKRLYHIVKSNKLICLMASRGLGKSFFFSIIYPAYISWLFDRVEILILNNTVAQVKSNFDKLKEIIETNELLDLKRGKKDDITWNNEEIWYNRGKIFARSLGAMTRGLHVNVAILDDILRDDGVYSDEFIKSYVNESVFPTVQKFSGKMVIVGTPQSSQDIFHNLMEDSDGDIIRNGAISTRGYYSEVFPAVLDEEKQIPYMPEWKNWEQLEEIKRTMNQLSFQKEYQCICVSDKTAIFPDTLLNKVFDDEIEWEDYGKEDSLYYIGADIATSGEASADFSAFVVIEHQEPEYETYVKNYEQKERLVSSAKKIVRHIVHVKGMPTREQSDTLAELSAKFNNAYILVEKNNVGVAIIQDLEDRGLNVGSIRSDKPKKEGAINFLRSEMQRGHFLIPDQEIAEILSLRKELRGFGIKIRRGKETMEAVTTKHDDLVDALYWANLATQQSGTGVAYAICQN